LFLEIIFHVYLVYELFTVNKGRLDNIGLSRKKMTGREPVLTRWEEKLNWFGHTVKRNDRIAKTHCRAKLPFPAHCLPNCFRF